MIYLGFLFEMVFQNLGLHTPIYNLCMFLDLPLQQSILIYRNFLAAETDFPASTSELNLLITLPSKSN